MRRNIFRKSAQLLSTCSLAFLFVISQQLVAQNWEQSIASGKQALAVGNFDLAETNFQFALKQTSQFRPDDPRRARSFMQMARFYQTIGDFARPEALYEQALAAAKLALGSNTTTYATYKHEVANYYHARRKYNLAESYYKEAFASRVQKFGRQHIDIGKSINDLGILYENKAIHEKARIYYEHALKIREDLLGPNNLKTIATVEHLARLLNKTREGAKALQFSDRAQIARQKEVSRYNLGIVQPDKIYSLSEVRHAPQLKFRVDPNYTDEARLARHGGVVVLQITINLDGTPSHFKLLRSLGLGLDENAVKAVRQWRFQPARQDGKKVAVALNLEILFRLM